MRIVIRAQRSGPEGPWRMEGFRAGSVGSRPVACRRLLNHDAFLAVREGLLSSGAAMVFQKSPKKRGIVSTSFHFMPW